MSDASTEARYLIRKGGAFYRSNCKGYTNSVIQAGRYTLEEAERETHPNGPDGPRDGMSHLHEDDAISDDWDSYRALAAERDALREASLILTKIVLAARKCNGDEPHRILPNIWPLICEADGLPSMPPKGTNHD